MKIVPISSHSPTGTKLPSLGFIKDCHLFFPILPRFYLTPQFKIWPSFDTFGFQTSFCFGAYYNAETIAKRWLLIPFYLSGFKLSNRLSTWYSFPDQNLSFLICFCTPTKSCKTKRLLPPEVPAFTHGDNVSLLNNSTPHWPRPSYQWVSTQKGPLFPDSRGQLQKLRRFSVFLVLTLSVSAALVSSLEKSVAYLPPPRQNNCQHASHTTIWLLTPGAFSTGWCSQAQNKFIKNIYSACTEDDRVTFSMWRLSGWGTNGTCVINHFDLILFLQVLIVVLFWFLVAQNNTIYSPPVPWPFLHTLTTSCISGYCFLHFMRKQALFWVGLPLWRLTFCSLT